MLLITHDLGVVAGLCDRVAVMYAGKLVEVGGADDVFADPAHPYTAGLLDSTPRLDVVDAAAGVDRRRAARSRRAAAGCPFAARCPIAVHAMPRGDAAVSRLRRGRRAACWRAFEVGRA